MGLNLDMVFGQLPKQWGYRGDPYLWDDMRKCFCNIHTPCTEEQFVDYFHKFFSELTGEEYDEQKDCIIVEKYKHGGMTSGGICIEFWKNILNTTLIERVEILNSWHIKHINNESLMITENEVKDHVAHAILKVLQLLNVNENNKVGIALPIDNKHKEIIDSMKLSLGKLNIDIYWTDGKNTMIEVCGERELI